MRNLALIVLALVVLAPAPASSQAKQTRQTRDDEFESKVHHPTYTPNTAPRIVIDEHHCNFHTAGGRYKPFAELLRRDGIRVEPLDSAFTGEALAGVDVLVIVNALAEENCKEWKLPTPSAFQENEILALAAWVEAGGALLLIADHMPFPGAAEGLARAFGLVFINGYVRPDAGGPWIRFDSASGSLAEHAVTSGLSEDETIEFVTSFTGQGFRSVRRDVIPLLILPAETTAHLPQKASTFDDQTPTFSAEGLLQGALVEHGKGRVAVFGEAAMFSAQEIERNGEIFRFGMNAPGAEQNSQFLLNVMHWLTGLLGEEKD